MKTRIVSIETGAASFERGALYGSEDLLYPIMDSLITGMADLKILPDISPEILFVTSYPPRECGIATYSQDLIMAIRNKFINTLTIKVCALESGDADFQYSDDIKYILKTSLPDSYNRLATSINNDDQIKIVLFQHEFGFFRKQEQSFLQLVKDISKPVIIVFHTVLPKPDIELKTKIENIAAACDSIIVMTHTSAEILTIDYELPKDKISVIAHGTHLVPHLSKNLLKKKYGAEGRKVLSTFGLLSAGKSIETTIEALPAIVKSVPSVLFLIIGKTHPEVLKEEGEQYRNSLEELIIKYNLTDNVRFINSFLPLPELLEYLQLTDIYIFTTNDPNQAVSGTFAYAMSCGCPIISTPIPHAKEVLTEDTGIIFDFRNSQMLADGVLRLLNNNKLRRNISINTLQKIVSTAWENSAVEHTMLFDRITRDELPIQYKIPAINLNHIKQMTNETGIIQFSKINQPDPVSGYTLDDNARAMVAICMHYVLTDDNKNLRSINKYLNFIKLCQQPSGNFLNYLDIEKNLTFQNFTTNLDDSNGRAVWSLGYLISERRRLPKRISSEAIAILEKAIPNLEKIHSPRAMAFAIKGLYFYQMEMGSPEILNIIITLADRLVNMFRHESNNDWQWFEGYLTYANSILPEAMLYAWLLTGEIIFKEIALKSFKFLLSLTFNENGIEVISNKSWMQRGQKAGQFGEQPIDVAYTILTLSKFYDTFSEEEYLTKMETAFNWFMGKNRLHQIIYNPCTGGCYDGLEESNVNLNQGAESTISYLMARLTLEKYNKTGNSSANHLTVLFTKKAGKIPAMGQDWQT